MKSKVYSYSRFSSDGQEEGDSERRQWAAAEAFAKEKGFEFDESLRMIDKAESAYRGKHRRKGVFGDFLKKVESRDVPPGSILVVENVDRLSRERPTDAWDTIVRGLLEQSIIIEVLSPQFTFTLETVNTQIGMMMLTMMMSLSHGESKKKSERIGASWMNKRSIASTARWDDPLQWTTSRVPGWLEVYDKKVVNNRVVRRKCRLTKGAQETIELIFKLKQDGHGKNAIAKKLNQSAAWKPENGWRGSYVEKILRSRAVIGEYQPHVIKDGKRVPEGEAIAGYFPAIVSPSLFNAVQQRIKGNKGKGGRTGKATNVFRHLVKCGYCGSSMDLVNKGDSPKGGQYLICAAGRRGIKCKAYSVRYHEFEETMLANLRRLRPETVLPNPDEAATEMKSLQTAIDGLVNQIGDKLSRIAILDEQIETTKDASRRTHYEQRIKVLETETAKLETEKSQKETDLHRLGHGAKSLAKWQTSLAGLMKAIKTNADTRIRLRTHLKEFVGKVEVFAKGHEDSVDHVLAGMDESRAKLDRTTRLAFIRYVRNRVRSSDGRFYVLHPLTAAGAPATGNRTQVHTLFMGLPIAPESSLGHRPNLDKLVKKFFDGRKRSELVPKASML